MALQLAAGDRASSPGRRREGVRGVSGEGRNPCAIATSAVPANAELALSRQRIRQRRSFKWYGCGMLTPADLLDRPHTALNHVTLGNPARPLFQAPSL